MQRMLHVTHFCPRRNTKQKLLRSAMLCVTALMHSIQGESYAASDVPCMCCACVQAVHIYLQCRPYVLHTSASLMSGNCTQGMSDECDQVSCMCPEAYVPCLCIERLALQADKDAREDRLQRDPDYDSHLGIERDPITREITHVAAST